MLNINDADVRGFSLAAKKSLLLLIICSMIFAGMLVGERAYFHSRIEAVSNAKLQANKASDTILLADEKLTMSALAYAGSADETMRTRYEDNLPVIDGAIADVKKMVSPHIAARFDAETRVANDRLVKMESMAFVYARNGNTQKARAIFDSPEYLANKASLANGSDKMLNALFYEIQVRSDQLDTNRRIVFFLMSLIAIIAFTVLVRRVRTSLNHSESAFFSAMAEMEASEKTAIETARRDALVGLPNRVFLVETISKKVAISQNITLLYLDLDGFKTVNDTYGHETGDELLQMVSRSLAKIVADAGILARLGGDEFAIMLCGNAALIQAENISEKIHQLFTKPFDINGRIANIGASIGIASMDDTANEPVELMRRADVAMYDAKHHGRNLTRHFNSDLDAAHRNDLDVAAEMRIMVANRQFDVAYQPIVDSKSSQVIGVEVLARWPANSECSFNPDYFIKIAEEQGIIDDLGALIFDLACADIAPMKQLRLAVNVSPLQLNHPEFLKNIIETARRHDFELNRLDIELTENVLIKYPERAKGIIAQLQSLGVTVSLDDFGTGFASVGYLREFGFDAVKLDQSLTQAVLSDPSAQMVAQGTILIANGLSASTVAEGIETVAESDVMRLLGCQKLQGFLYGRPASIEALLSLKDASGNLQYRNSKAA